MASWVVVVIVALSMAAAAIGGILFIQERKERRQSENLRLVLEATKRRAKEQAAKDVERFKQSPSATDYVEWRRQMDELKRRK